MKASDLLYATGGVRFLGGLWGLRRALTWAGRTVNRLVPRQPIDQLPPASHTAWVGVAPVATEQHAGGEQP